MFTVSSRFFFSPDLKKWKLVYFLKINAVPLASVSAFIGNRYVQQARGENLRYENLRYHVYFFSSGGLLQDPIIYSYNWSLSIADDNGFVEATEVVTLNVEIVKVQ